MIVGDRSCFLAWLNWQKFTSSVLHWNSYYFRISSVSYQPATMQSSCSSIEYRSMNLKDSKMPCKLITVVMRSSPPPQRQPGQDTPRIASTIYTFLNFDSRVTTVNWLCMVAVIPANWSEWQSGTYSLHDMPRTPSIWLKTVMWGNKPGRPVACCKKLWAVSLQLKA